MNAEIIHERILDARAKANRQDKIYFVAVSKTRSIDEMREAERFSCIDFFGENRVQEAETKRAGFESSRLEWRLIGHLQANKARKAVELFDTIDSIDSIELASRVDRIAGELNRKMRVLLEVNTSGESSKSGVAPEDFARLFEHVLTLPNLNLEGLMTVGPITESEREIRSAFASLRELTERARASSGLELPIISMGMSDDFELAILEGSTMVRIGTLLFGPRDYTH